MYVNVGLSSKLRKKFRKCFTKRTSNRVLKCLVGSKQTDYILMIDIHITTLSQIPIVFYSKKKKRPVNQVYSC